MIMYKLNQHLSNGFIVGEMNESEFYLRDGNSFELVITPLNGKKGKVARMTLEGLPEGEARISLTLQMKEEGILYVMAKDLGFGEFRAATNRVWEETLRLYD